MSLFGAVAGASPPTNFHLNQAIANVATCNLNQWVLDFKGNRARIIRSIREAAARGCKYRIGPELEVPGYSCEDHFYELDTYKFSIRSFEMIVAASPPNIICDIGMPMIITGVRYNCRIFYLKNEDNKTRILLIRPKMWLADDGNYRESRWFTPWSKEKLGKDFENFPLTEFSPEFIANELIPNHGDIPFGIGIIETNDATIASETCEELFTPQSPNIMLGLEGVDIITNGSGSHWQIGKYKYRHDLISSATKRNGGVYLYSNLLGCEGNRVVFDGNGMIYLNGDCINIGEHLSFADVEVVSALVNLDHVRAYRESVVSRNLQASQKEIKLPRVKVEFNMTSKADNTLKAIDTVKYDAPMSKDDINRAAKGLNKRQNEETNTEFYELEEEMALGISRHLWDYLCRSQAGGFFLPLSGGVDSSSTAMMVFYMCDKVLSLLKDLRPLPTLVNLDTLIEEGESYKMKDLILNKLNNIIIRQISAKKKVNYHPEIYAKIENETAITQDLVNIFLHTCNMPTKYNTPAIMRYATILAINLGSYHIVAPLQKPFLAMQNIVNEETFEILTRKDDEISYKTGAELRQQDRLNIPRFLSNYGDLQQHLAIQNVQARLRMITAYYLAQILPGHRYNQEVKGADEWAAYQQARNSLTNANPPTAEFMKINNDIISERANARYLLVLASSNSDESLRGFYTKYDASSADINPIGSFSKTDLRKFLKWCYEVKYSPEKSTPINTRNTSLDAFKQIYDAQMEKIDLIQDETKRAAALQSMEQKFTINGSRTTMKYKDGSDIEPPVGFRIIKEILEVTASPELAPPTLDKKGNEIVQDDEVDIGMTYAEIYYLGNLRKRDGLGAMGMFQQMCKDYIGPDKPFLSTIKKDEESNIKYTDTRVPATPKLIAFKVLNFWGYYTLTRNKMTTITASIHATNYSPDDNRFDQRPFLYNADSFWYREGNQKGSDQAVEIIKLANKMESEQPAAPAPAAPAPAAPAGVEEAAPAGVEEAAPAPAAPTPAAQRANTRLRNPRRHTRNKRNRKLYRTRKN